MNGPDGEADDWRFIRGKIVADDGTVNYEGIEQVSGRHFQHVANNALQQDMFDAIVNDPKRCTWRRERTSARRSSSGRARCSASTSSTRPSSCTTRRGSTRRRATSTTPRAPSPLRRAAPAWALERSASTTARGCLGASRATSARRESRAHAVALRAPQRHALGRVQLRRLVGHGARITQYPRHGHRPRLRRLGKGHGRWR